MSLLKFTSHGIYCEAGDFFIDPWRPVTKALITHAHSDHARYGMQHYLTHPTTAAVMRYRLGKDISVQEINYHQTLNINGVLVSFHPAGHIPGSSQIRLEHKGEVWVAAGDYKTTEDGLSEAFELVKCHTFITESTFGLPVFKWKSNEELMNEVAEWWQKNREQGLNSVLFCYSLGKAQRLLQALGDQGLVYGHGAVLQMNEALNTAGHQLKKCLAVDADKGITGSLILAPPSAENSSWLKRFGEYTTATASGWMQIRGTRRRSTAQTGFVISDHADWPGLLSAIKATNATRVITTHGYADILTKFLNECGLESQTESTEFGEEEPITTES